MNQQELFNDIQTRSIAVGSRVYNAHSPKSDYDFAMTEELYEELFLPEIKNLGIDLLNVKQYGGQSAHTLFNKRNIKFWLGRKLINILTYSLEDIEKIHKVQIFLLSVYETPIGRALLNNKHSRVDLFQLALKEQFGKLPKNPFKSNS